MCAFDSNKKYRVSVGDALGAVLLQLNDTCFWQPVEYASRNLTDTETCYAMIEKEALAIMWPCEKFDSYLVGRSFETETDHRALVSILGEQHLPSLPVRVQRFRLHLVHYDYMTSHTLSKDMFIADALRRPDNFTDSMGI